MDALIQLDGLGCCFTDSRGNRAEALAGVDLTVNAGERWALMGRNGSGKSTMLLAVAGLIEPSAGMVLFRGHPLAKAPGYITGDRITLVMADVDVQIIGVSVEEDLAFGLYQQGLSQDEVTHRIDEVLELFGLEDFRRFAPHELPVCRRTLLAMAGAVAPKPDVLLLDEISTFLDERGREAAERALAAVKKSGGAVVQVTHEVHEAARCDKVAILDRGKVVAAGNPCETLSDPVCLDKWGIRVPDALRLWAALDRPGMDQGVFTHEELVERLCR